MPLLSLADITQPGSATRWLTHFLRIDRDDVVGCTEAEVDEVQAACVRPLPAGYKQWLREAGRRVGPPHVNSHFRRSYLLYPMMFELREDVIGFMEDSQASDALLETAFPFFFWEGYRLCLLDLSVPNDDPPILQLDERTGRPFQVLPSLSSFIGWEIFVLADALAFRSDMESGGAAS
jgi:hypothetical protein